MRKRKKQAKRPAATRDPRRSTAASIFDEALDAILSEIRGVVDGSRDPSPHDAASRIAWLAKQAASVAAEQRKAESAELAAARRLTHAQVMLWARQQTPEYRAALQRDLETLDSDEPRNVIG